MYPFFRIHTSISLSNLVCSSAFLHSRVITVSGPPFFFVVANWLWPHNKQPWYSLHFSLHSPMTTLVLSFHVRPYSQADLASHHHRFFSKFYLLSLFFVYSAFAPSLGPFSCIETRRQRQRCGRFAHRVPKTLAKGVNTYSVVVNMNQEIREW